MGNCSCEVNCNEDNILALKEEEDQNETPPLIWKSLTPLLPNTTIKSKRLELKDIILVHLYLKNMKDFSSINSAYVTTFKHCLPARVCVETVLPEEVLFSIDCLIRQSDIKIDDGLFHPKEIPHVQNISHWAPANIGPYSQSIKVGEVMYPAGQIALIPSTMKLVSGRIQTEAPMSLSHTLKILEALHRGTGLHHILMAHC
ncbi:uncharacterized protein LOC103000372 [Balaenoptera acutorostrata]|uniref:Uncharacterized protein LOC103000372 n=1 Tax=Balaenoptera acutorostrata TaxID=9767 RepID=A0A383ZZL7_BALAC|nr:uncharacterized protein LOC103000372 [Balaenoptera acutorostrata]